MFEEFFIPFLNPFTHNPLHCATRTNRNIPVTNNFLSGLNDSRLSRLSKNAIAAGFRPRRCRWCKGGKSWAVNIGS
jgi:hypothetical protein